MIQTQNIESWRFFIMKDCKATRIVVVTGETGAEFEKRFNECMETLKMENVSFEFNKSIGHCAYITYTEKWKEPEGIEDEYALRGETYHCGDCPYLELNPDGRRKEHQCRDNRNLRYKTDPACRRYYLLREMGTI